MFIVFPNPPSHKIPFCYWTTKASFTCTVNVTVFVNGSSDLFDTCSDGQNVKVSVTILHNVELRRWLTVTVTLRVNRPLNVPCAYKYLSTPWNVLLVHVGKLLWTVSTEATVTFVNLCVITERNVFTALFTEPQAEPQNDYGTEKIPETVHRRTVSEYRFCRQPGE